MSQFFYDKYGIKRNWSDFNTVEHLFKLKTKSSKDPWPVIEEILKLWEKKVRKANKWDSYIFELESTRETRANAYAASDEDADPVHNGILRYVLDIPEFVVAAIRMVYTPDELPMNKEFNEAFAHRYPHFKIAEKI